MCIRDRVEAASGDSRHRALSSVGGHSSTRRRPLEGGQVPQRRSLHLCDAQRTCQGWTYFLGGDG
eukprot:6950933-Heterocapsa_arctica.AAC.1